MKKSLRYYLSFLVFVTFLSVPGQGADIEKITHNNVVIILDGSGSMRSEIKGTKIVKMDAAKAALKEVLQTVPQDTNIGLMVFTDSIRGNGWFYPLGPRDNEKLLAAIDLPQAAGSTPLGAFIRDGANRLMEIREEQFGYGTYRLLVVTDGEATDKELMNEIVPKINAKGIIIDAIGVDMTSDHTLATKVNSYRRANDPKALKEALSEVFAEVSDSDSTTVSEDAFSVIQGIPIEMAQKILKSLTTVDNQKLTDTQDSVIRSPSKKQDKFQPPRQGQPTQSQMGKKNSKIGGTLRLALVLTFAIFFIVAVRSIKK